MELINKANTNLINAKRDLIEAERIASSIEEKTYIVAVQKRVQEGIQEIFHNFFPKTEFNVQDWLKRRTSKDAEHDARVQKILDDSARRQRENETKHCLFDYSDEGVAKTWKDDPDSDDPDSPNYRQHPDDYPNGDDMHELITGKD
jgi:hypothetical protein